MKLPDSCKFPARSAHILLPLVISIFMSCVVSGVATVRSLGFTDGVFSIWMSGWAVSWIIAFPTLLLVLPLARKIVAAITKAA